MADPTPHNMVESLLKAIDINRTVLPPGGAAMAVVRSHEKLVSLEPWMSHPERVRRTVRHSCFKSFLHYLDENHNHAARCYVEKERVVAIFDHHDVDGDPDWEQHRSEFALVPSAPAAMWHNNVTKDGRKSISQMELALLMERRVLDVVTPDAATMMEIALTLEAKPKVEWKSAMRLQDGSRQFLFEETVAARAGIKGGITIPERFTLGLALYEGCAAISLDVKLRYRIDGGVIAFTLEWADLDEAERQTREAIVSIIADKHECPTFLASVQSFHPQPT